MKQKDIRVIIQCALGLAGFGLCRYHQVIEYIMSRYFLEERGAVWPEPGGLDTHARHRYFVLLAVLLSA